MDKTNNNLQELIGKHLAISSRYGQFLIEVINGTAIEKEPRIVLPNPIAIEGTTYASKLANIGVLNIKGMIIPYASWLERYFNIVSVENLTKDFQTMLDDKTIDKIVFKMDTPGGYITEISEFSEMVKRSEKDVIAHVVGDAASGGYWIASQANKITSVNTGVIGSIGVVATVVDNSKWQDKVGVKYIELISPQTPRKRTDLTTAEGQKEVLDVLYDMADVFLNAVSVGRNKPTEEIMENFGKGAEVSAQEGLKRGMIDEIIGTNNLLESIKIKPSPITRLANKPEGDEKMAGENEKKPDLDLLQKESEAKAKKETIERMKSFEAISKKFDGYDPQVVEAVKKVIDDHKYEDDMTVGNLENLALKAANEKQKELLAAARKPRTDLGKKLEAVPDIEDEQAGGGKGKVDKERVEQMCAGWKKVRPII